jgi:hypothetical protein
MRARTGLVFAAMGLLPVTVCSQSQPDFVKNRDENDQDNAAVSLLGKFLQCLYTAVVDFAAAR